MVYIDENILLGAAVAIFIPLFVFLVKLIIEVGNIKGKIETIMKSIEEHKRSVDDMYSVKTDLKLIDMRLDHIENELRTKKGAPVNSHNRSSSRFNHNISSIEGTEEEGDH